MRQDNSKIGKRQSKEINDHSGHKTLEPPFTIYIKILEVLWTP